MSYSNPQKLHDEAAAHELGRRYRRARAALQRSRPKNITVDVPIGTSINSVYDFQNGFISVERVSDAIKISIYKRLHEEDNFRIQYQFNVPESSLRVDDLGKLHCNFHIELDWLVGAEFVLDTNDEIIGIKGANCYNESFIAIGINDANHNYSDDINTRFGDLKRELSQIASERRSPQRYSRHAVLPIIVLMNIRRKSLFWLLGFIDVNYLRLRMLGVVLPYSNRPKCESYTTGAPNNENYNWPRAGGHTRKIKRSGSLSKRARGYSRFATPHRPSDSSEQTIGYELSSKLSMAFSQRK